MGFTKIQDNDFINKDVVSAPDKLVGNASQNKAIFDRAVKEVVKVAVNRLADEIAETGADNIDVSATDLSATTINEALSELSQNKVDKVEGKELSTNDYTTVEKNKLNALPDKTEIDGNFALKADKSDVYTKFDVYTKAEVDNKVAAVYKYKGSVGSAVSLPTLNRTVGDVYNVVATGMNYAWNGVEWDALGSVEALATATNDGLLSKEDFAKIQNIAEGAQVNVIEKVMVNGTELAVTDKEVNIEMYTKAETDSKLDDKADKNDLTASQIRCYEYYADYMLADVISEIGLNFSDINSDLNNCYKKSYGDNLIDTIVPGYTINETTGAIVETSGQENITDIILVHGGAAYYFFDEWDSVRGVAWYSPNGTFISFEKPYITEQYHYFCVAPDGAAKARVVLWVYDDTVVFGAAPETYNIKQINRVFAKTDGSNLKLRNLNVGDANYPNYTKGAYSGAVGYGLNTENSGVYASFVTGRLNKPLSGANSSFVATADAFVIGNGAYNVNRSNAFRVTFDGKVYGLDAFNSTGADYAEYFEWADGNPDGEDRAGYFVTLEGDKIRKATADDTYILGVISVNPSVVGDSYQDNWKGMYVTDEWGRIQYHYVDVPEEIDENGNIITEAHQDYVPMINPEWDSSQQYIPREKRIEWAAVGIMGKLLVRDDGSCGVNGFCKPNDEGIATTSNNGYRVMKRVADNIVQILIK